MRLLSTPFRSALLKKGVIKKVFLEILQNSQENACAWDSFLIKLQARPATLLKKRLWHRCFPINFVKFPRTSFFTEPLRWLLLNCPLIILYRLIKTCSDSTKQPPKIQWQMSAPGYFDDSDHEFINHRIILLCPKQELNKFNGALSFRALQNSAYNFLFFRLIFNKR